LGCEGIAIDRQRAVELGKGFTGLGLGVHRMKTRQHGVTTIFILAAVTAVSVFWSREALVSETYSAELVRELFRLTLETPSIMFATPDDARQFDSEFHQEADANLAWLGDRVQTALDARDPSAVDLGPFQEDLPLVYGRLDPEEEGSLERAPAGPLRYVIGLRIEGEAPVHVPRMTMVKLELTLRNRPSRQALRALVTSIEASLAAKEAEEPRS